MDVEPVQPAWVANFFCLFVWGQTTVNPPVWGVIGIENNSSNPELPN